MLAGRWAIATAAAIGIAGAALGNDSTAETGAGGLVLQRTDAIDMVSEDLFISADQVRVRYVFRNRTPKEVETLIAFPMPGRDLAALDEGDVAFPSGFKTSVEGRPVIARLERKAIAKGKDQTALLARLGIPLVPDAKRGTSPIIAALDRLPPEHKARLHAMGLVRGEPYSDHGKVAGVHLLPQWTVQDAWFWRQRFPPGHDLHVEHAYRPGTGGSVDSVFAHPELRNRAEGLRAAELFCVDGAFLAGVDGLRARNPAGLPEKRVSYVLSTAANWRSPIAAFRLVVDKGRPANIVSFCGGGVKKLGPTQFEVKYRNFRPMRDFHVLILEPRG
ncbi:MAG: DUF4424 family protein [Sphingomicrobium sp.]